MKPSDYEEKAKQQIWLWKNPERTWFEKSLKLVSWPLDKTAESVLQTIGLGPIIRNALAGMLGVINDASHWSVRTGAILEEYRRFTGKSVNVLSDIYTLDLESVDHVIGWLAAKYEGLSLVEGAAAGAGGTLNPIVAVAVIPADVIALMTLNLRAVGEYASYCGFDVASQEERLFALNVLAYASSPSDASKQLTLAQLIRIARDVAIRKSWKDLEEHAAVQAIQQIARMLSIRLTKAKLAQILPVAGAAIGGGFNAYYTSKVCNAAFYLYRERFLAEKYGVSTIEITVEPAKNLEPEFGQEQVDLGESECQR